MITRNRDLKGKVRNMMKHCKLTGIILAGVIALGYIHTENIMYSTDVQAASTKEIDAKKKSAIKISDTYKGSVTLYGGKKKLTISGGKRMKSLTIQSEAIEKIKFRNKLMKLKKLNVYEAGIKNLDFGKMPNLEEIATSSAGTISNAKKGWLKLNGIKKLKDITIYGTTYNPLSVTNCKRLKKVFFCGRGKVSIKNCPKMKSVDCDACTSLEIIGCSGVRSVNCRNSNASIKKCPNIVSLDLGMKGNISLKDLYGCKNLQKLVAKKTIISKLDKYKLPKLKEIVVAEEEASDE